MHQALKWAAALLFAVLLAATLLSCSSDSRSQSGGASEPPPGSHSGGASEPPPESEPGGASEPPPESEPGGASEPPPEYQLVVYGGTPAGVMAAVTAAEEGLKVALVEPGSHIGGMMSGGLGATDTGRKYLIGGRAYEFFQRTGKSYGSEVAWRFEPHVAEEVLTGWLREAGVALFHGLRVVAAQKNAGRISSIAMHDGSSFTAQVYVDASYEGDLMALSGVSYTVGRESRLRYGESLAGRRPYGASHQFTVPLPAYDGANRLIPLVREGDAAAEGDGDLKIQAYNYRLCLTDNTENQVPFAMPPGYDPARYEILKRYLALRGTYFRLKNLMYPAPLPNGKTDTNNAGPISTDLVGGNWEYPEADHARREEIKEEHKRYIQGFLYFLANDPSVPAGLQADTRRWGLARDEFADNGHWPYQIYVREARRMIGSHVMTQADLQTARVKEDSIGMGSYNSDSHHVQRVVTPEGYVMNEGGMEVPVQPYEIPYRSITPQAGECQNLLVPVCVSASHVAYSSLRMEPQYMIMGEAAGVAAYLAVRDGKGVQEIGVAQLQSRLRARRQVLSLADVDPVRRAERSSE